MKQSLYEIEKKYLVLAEQLNENGGELTPELEQELTISNKDLQTKGVNYAFIIKDFENSNQVIDNEIKRLKRIKEVNEKTIARLEYSISNAMKLFGIDKIETPILKISFRRSESVEVLDLNLLNKKYIKTSKPIESADKDLIKKDIKDGKNIQGAILKINQNLQIK